MTHRVARSYVFQRLRQSTFYQKEQKQKEPLNNTKSEQAMAKKRRARRSGKQGREKMVHHHSPMDYTRSSFPKSDTSFSWNEKEGKWVAGIAYARLHSNKFRSIYRIVPIDHTTRLDRSIHKQSKLDEKLHLRSRLGSHFVPISCRHSAESYEHRACRGGG